MATRPLSVAASRCFRRLSAVAAPPPAGGSGGGPTATAPLRSKAAVSPSSPPASGCGGAPTPPTTTTLAQAPGTVASTTPPGGTLPPAAAGAAGSNPPPTHPDVHSTGLGLDPDIDPASVDPLRYRKAAWKYGGALLLFLPAYTYLTQFAIPEAEAKKKVRRAKAAAAEAEVEAEKAKAAEGRVVEPVMPSAMRGAWGGGGGVGATVGEVDGQALMQATAQQQAEAQQVWEQQRRAAMASAGGEGGQSPVAAGGDVSPLLPALGSAPMRSAGDGPAHQMFPSVNDGAEDAVSAADELALRVRYGWLRVSGGAFALCACAALRERVAT